MTFGILSLSPLFFSKMNFFPKIKGGGNMAPTSFLMIIFLFQNMN